jgi:hypothetical protein
MTSVTNVYRVSSEWFVQSKRLRQFILARYLFYVEGVSLTNDRFVVAGAETY